jgi:hypothetical protein
VDEMNTEVFVGARLAVTVIVGAGSVSAISTVSVELN